MIEHAVAGWEEARGGKAGWGGVGGGGGGCLWLEWGFGGDREGRGWGA